MIYQIHHCLFNELKNNKLGDEGDTFFVILKGFFQK